MGGHNIINDYIAGAVGGSAGLIVGHPFDTTKVQLQTRQTSSAYKSTWDAIKHINQAGLTKGFFRGLGFPLVTYGAINSVFFGVYGSTLRFIQGSDLKRKTTHSDTFFAGCCGGFFQLFIACPVDVVKVVLQSQIDKTTGRGTSCTVTANPNYFRGPIQCIGWLYRQHGVWGFYQGLIAMAMRDIPTYGVYTLVYEMLYNRTINLSMFDTNGVGASMLAGGVAGVTCWTLAMPMDVVKSRMQADNTHSQFRSTWHCIQSVYIKKGTRGFFTGWTVCSIRAFPVNAVTFLFYEQTLRMLNTRPSRKTQLNDIEPI